MTVCCGDKLMILQNIPMHWQNNKNKIHLDQEKLRLL